MRAALGLLLNLFDEDLFLEPVPVLDAVLQLEPVDLLELDLELDEVLLLRLLDALDGLENLRHSVLLLQRAQEGLPY